MDYIRTLDERDTQSSTSISVEVDPQDIVFDKLIDSWVEGEITYDDLMHYYPTYDSSMVKKILSALRKLFL